MLGLPMNYVQCTDSKKERQKKLKLNISRHCLVLLVSYGLLLIKELFGECLLRTGVCCSL
jgi:hypothetical protein